MLEPVTYSVSELAQRWNVTPRQILDMALQLRVPLYFNFDGLAFELTDRWHRYSGGNDTENEIKALEKDIKDGNARLAQRARGELGEYDYLSDEDVRELREAITKNQHKVEKLKDKLEERERKRRHAHYLGPIRAAPQTLRDIQRDGECNAPHKGYHPASVVRVMPIPATNGGPDDIILEGHLLALEPYLTPWRKLTADSLFAMTAEVKAIEAHQQSKDSAAQMPASAPPATTTIRAADDSLAELIRGMALDYVASERQADRYPSQLAIGDFVARKLREKGVPGKSGKPLSGEYIKRHYLQGITSNKN